MVTFDFLKHRFWIIFILLIVCSGSILADQNSNVNQKNRTEKDIYKQIDQLFQKAQNTSDSKLKLHYLGEIIYMSNPSALLKIKAKALFESGLEWKRRGDYIEALDYLSKAQLIYAQIKDLENENLVKIDLADTYRASNSFENARTILSSTFSYFEQTKNKKKMALIYNRMASILLELFYNEPYYNKHLPQPSTTKEEFMKIMNQNKKLTTLYEDVFNYLDLSNQIAQREKLYDILISNLNIEGFMHISVSDIKTGLQFFDKALDMVKETNTYDEYPLILINKARIYGVFKLKNAKLAIQYAEEGLQYAKDHQMNIYMYMASNVLYENFAYIGNYEKAFYYLQNYEMFNRRFKNDNLVLKLGTKEFEVKIKEREEELKIKKIQQTVLLIFIIVIVLLSGIFLLIYIKKTNKQKKLLIELHEKNEIISIQNSELESLNLEKDRLFSIIGHDLRTPFNSILGFGELIHDDYATLTKDEIKTYSGFIIQSSKHTLTLLENLLIWAKLQQNRIIFNPKEVNIQKMINEVSLFFHESLKNKNITLKTTISEWTQIKADEEMLKTILRNLIGNSIKFSHAGGIIEIVTVLTPIGIKFTVQDNGVGIEQEDIEKLFQFDSKVIKPGTNNEKGSGMGLIICKEMIEKHGGTLWIESKVGIGTSFHFTIPNN